MMLRSIFIALVAIGVFAHRTPAQATTAAPSAVGVWRGTSLCLVRPSPCHDEHVIYRVTRASPGRYKLDAYKIVGGRELFMGAIDLKFEPAKTQGQPVPVSILLPVFFRHPDAPPLAGDSVIKRDSTLTSSSTASSDTAKADTVKPAAAKPAAKKAATKPASKATTKRRTTRR